MRKVSLYLYWISAHDNHTNEILRFSAIAPNMRTALEMIYETYAVSNGTGRRIKYVSSRHPKGVTPVARDQKNAQRSASNN